MRAQRFFFGAPDVDHLRRPGLLGVCVSRLALGLCHRLDFEQQQAASAREVLACRVARHHNTHLQGTSGHLALARWHFPGS